MNSSNLSKEKYFSLFRLSHGGNNLDTLHRERDKGKLHQGFVDSTFEHHQHRPAMLYKGFTRDNKFCRKWIMLTCPKPHLEKAMMANAKRRVTPLMILPASSIFCFFKSERRI